MRTCCVSVEFTPGWRVEFLCFGLSRTVIVPFWCVTNGLFNLQKIRHSHGEFAYNSSFFLDAVVSVFFFAFCFTLKRSRCVVSCRWVCRWSCTETERARDRVFALMDMLSMKIKRAEWPPRQGESGRGEWGMKRCPHRYSLLNHLIWQPGTKLHRVFVCENGAGAKSKEVEQRWSGEHFH